MPALEPLITRLIQDAPVRDPATVAALIAALRADGSPLATAIARAVEGVDAGRIDPGIALPALAMACATLADPRLTAREHEAARYEVETLLPVPARAGAAPVHAAARTAPDVPVEQLTRGPRPRT